jgi:PHD/YefM family antitoxin component YafN of YafNO toxin-antitoxin module
MKNTYTVTEGQANFPRIVRLSATRPVAIERHGAVQAYVIGRERMEAIAETMELLANEGFRKTLARYRAGRLKMRTLADA